jgi:hypothetical protein
MARLYVTNHLWVHVWGSWRTWNGTRCGEMDSYHAWKSVVWQPKWIAWWGYLQGGVLLPLMWNLVIHVLLVQLKQNSPHTHMQTHKHTHTHTEDYAEDTPIDNWDIPKYYLRAHAWGSEHTTKLT